MFVFFLYFCTIICSDEYYKDMAAMPVLFSF